MRHNKQRNVMSRGQRRLVQGCLAALVATGAVWLSVHFLAWPAMSRAQMEGLPSPWEHTLMQIHGLGVFLMLFLAGRVSVVHVKRGWRLGLHRRTGLVMIATLSLLAISGYALDYLIPDDWRDGLGLAHAAVGFLCGAMFLWHRRAAWHK